MMDFALYILKRNTWHALIGSCIGLSAAMMPFAWNFLVIYGALFFILIKEILIDPHPKPRYWVKSSIDLSVWAVSIYGVFSYLR